MIELKLRLDKVDYDALAELLLPMLFEQMSEAADAPVWSRVLLRSQGMTERAAKAVLDRMSEEQKDALLVRYVNKNSPALCHLLEDMAARSGVHVKLGGAYAATTGSV